MNWLSTLLGTGVSDIIDSVGNGIDRLVTSDQERLQLKNELALGLKAMQLEVEKGALEHEKEITQRWTSDNEHGSFLSRNIRPLSLVYLLGVISVLAFADGNIGDFKVDSAYVDLFQALALTAFGGYFVARSFDKHTKSKENR